MSLPLSSAWLDLSAGGYMYHYHHITVIHLRNRLITHPANSCVRKETVLTIFDVSYPSSIMMHEPVGWKFLITASLKAFYWIREWFMWCSDGSATSWLSCCVVTPGVFLLSVVSSSSSLHQLALGSLLYFSSVCIFCFCFFHLSIPFWYWTCVRGIYFWLNQL